MFKYLVLTLFALATVGCSFDKNGNSISEQRAKENNALIQKFSTVEGNYKGTLVLGGISYNALLSLTYTIQADPVEKDDNGQPLPQVITYGTLKRINPVGTDYSFKATYVSELEYPLILTNDDVNQGPGNQNTPGQQKNGANSPGGSGPPGKLGPDEPYSIESKVVLDEATKKVREINGVVKNSSGVKIGSLRLTISSQQHETPNEKPEQAYYDRLKAEYEAIAGDYVGNSVLDSAVMEYILAIRVRTKQIDDLLVPEFYGTFKRTDDRKGGGALSLSTFSYSPAQKHLTMDGVPMHYPNSDYVAKFDGYIRDNSYIASWSTKRGFEGNLSLKRIRTVKKDTEEETPEVDECSEQALAASWPTLPKEGPIPTPRPKCH